VLVDFDAYVPVLAGDILSLRRYRRNRIPGGTCFFTVTLRDRRSQLLVQHIDRLRDVFRAVHEHQPLRLDAMVILPGHVHAVWTLPAGDSDYPSRCRAIKSHFSREVNKQGAPLQRNARGEYRLWQRRYGGHTLRDDEDRRWHIDYLHYNPVKHGLVKRVSGLAICFFSSLCEAGFVVPRLGRWAAIAKDRGELGEGSWSKPTAG
jgi:putative transposase